MKHLLLITLVVCNAQAQTQIDLRNQTRNVDFTGAVSTRPVKTGTSLPLTCTSGDLFLNTAAPSGANFYACVASAWSLQGGGPGGAIIIQDAGRTVASRSTENFIAGSGILNVLSDDGQKINIQAGVDTAAILSRATDQSGIDRFCRSSGANQTQYSCNLLPALTAYSIGMTLNWMPDVSCIPGPLTLNVDTLGAASVKQTDGISDLTSCIAGSAMTLIFDGVVFRTLSGGASGGGATSVDTSVILSRADDQSGADRYCASSGGDPSQYHCGLTPALTAYTSGMVLIWKPDVACATGPLTLSVSGLAAKPVRQADGTSNPNTCIAGSLIPLGFDGAVFRILNVGASTSGSATATGASISRGPFSSIPACTSAVFEYLATDSPYTFHCDGAYGGQWFFGGNPQTPASTLPWTWFNQTGSSIDTVGGTQVLTGTSSSSGNSIQGRQIPIPSTPYSVTACFSFPLIASPYNSGGLYLTDGAGVIEFGVSYAPGGQASISTAYLPNATTWGGGYLSTTALAQQSSCLTVSDNGTTRKFWVADQFGSLLGGSRVLLGTTPSNDRVAPNGIGFFVNSAGSNVAPRIVLYTFTTVSESI